MRKLILIILLLGAFSLPGKSPCFYGPADQPKILEKVRIKNEPPPVRSLTLSALADRLVSENIIEPEIVLKQAQIESGNFTSLLCTKYNNIFGMKRAGQRSTTAIGHFSGYAVYSSWQDCVKDYYYFQQWYIKRGRKLKNNYYSFLKSIGYAADPHYIAKLKEI